MTEGAKFQLGIEEIRAFLPHRFPFLLIDRVLSIEPKGDLSDMAASDTKLGVRVVAQKNVSVNEPIFTGHFPNFAIFPGVMMVEAMAQAASFSLYPYLKHAGRPMSDFQCVLVGADGCRFRRPVVPGDVMVLESVVTKCRGQTWGFDVEIKVEGQRVAEGQILANLMLKGEPK